MQQNFFAFSPFHQGLYDQIVRLSDEESLFKSQCQKTAEKLSGFSSRFKGRAFDSQEILSLTQQAQRLVQIFAAKLQNNAEFRQELQESGLRSWESWERLDIDSSIQKSLADKLYNVTDAQTDKVVVELGDKSPVVAGFLLERLLAERVNFIINFRDPDFLNLIFKHADESGVQNLGEYELLKALPATKRIVAYPLIEDHRLIAPSHENKGIYDRILLPIRMKSSSGETLSTLTFFPSRKEAEIDRIEYPEYLRLFFEMCDQPWERIRDAQKHLIEQFNAASHVRIRNDWGTDIEMSLIDENGVPFTFCNSLIAKNIPGSEIFSAPRRDSVNGRIVSYGRFNHDGPDIIENLRLHFKDGCLRTWAAEKGVEHFTRFIEGDAGNRYVGELGIGTNPHLKQHVSNGLLVEKIGGSFHLALGDAYKMKDYLGDPVHVDNGNRSKDHWDITTMLFGAGGSMELDGRKIMEKGFFLDEKLDVLNRGWQAVPYEERPDYWKKAATPFGPKV